MIEVINSKDLKTDADLVCTNCFQEYYIKEAKEGIDYIFERDTETGEEWCICIKCREENYKI